MMTILFHHKMEALCVYGLEESVHSSFSKLLVWRGEHEGWFLSTPWTIMALQKVFNFRTKIAVVSTHHQCITLKNISWL